MSEERNREPEGSGPDEGFRRITAIPDDKPVDTEGHGYKHPAVPDEAGAEELGRRAITDDKPAGDTRATA